MNEEAIRIGKALKAQREAHGYNANKLARITGIQYQNIYRWESGKFLPKIDVCIKLADFYDITLDELVGREVD